MNKELAISILRGDVLGTNEQTHEAVFMAIKALKAEPVRHGHWIKMSDADGHYYACSECGEELHREWSFDREFDIFPKKITIDKTQFCPHCGARMDSNDSNALNALNALEMDEVTDDK